MVRVRYWFQIASTSTLLLWLCVAAAQVAPAAIETVAAGKEIAAKNLESQLVALNGKRHPFKQQTFNAYGELLETSDGELSLLAPNARWEVFAPFPQIVLLNDKELKIYDPDLEQLTVRQIAGSRADIPLAILLNHELLEDHFQVFEEKKGVYAVTPTAFETLFTKMRLTFNAGRIQMIWIVDHSLQVTEINFEQRAQDQVVQSEFFELVLPPGTEIVRG